jgi:hypothetical protein
MNGYLFIAIPFALIAYSVCFWRGAWRLAALPPLLLLVVYLFYISGRKTGSNMPSIGDLLAMGGLFLAWIYLVLLYIAKAFAWLGLKDSNQ